MYREVQKSTAILALRLFGKIITAGVLFIAGQASAQEVQRQSTIRSAPVTVTNTPLPVTVTNQPATPAVTPFIGRCRLDLNFSGPQGPLPRAQECAVEIFTQGGGTGGKQLVVQAVSAIVNGLDPGVMPGSAFFGGPVIDGVDAGFYHYVPLSLQGKDPGGSGYFAGMQSLTWIQDPRATRVVCGVLLLAQSVLNGNMTCTVTGYLQ